MTTFKTRNITSADANGTVVVCRKGDTPTPHTLAFITINKLSAHALAIYNGEASTGTLIGTLVASAPERTYFYYAEANKGIAIVVPSGFVGDVTVSFI